MIVGFESNYLHEYISNFDYLIGNLLFNGPDMGVFLVVALFIPSDLLLAIFLN